MSVPSFDVFAAQAREQGFDEVVERQWQANEVVPTHAHPFDARAVVVQGEMWLQVGQTLQHLHPGDRFELQRDIPHDERYGSEGATYWVARRSR